MDSSIATGERSAEVRRAAVFGALLVVTGAVAVSLRIFGAGVHPQLVLLLYSVPANAAISIFSHEVALYDYGSHQPILLTTLSATAGTAAAAWLDWQVFVPLLDARVLTGYRLNRLYRWCIERFERAPFLVLSVAAFTPVPVFPFKFLAFSVRYPLGRYVAAVALSRAPRYAILAWLGSAYRVPEWVLLALFLALLALGLAHSARVRELLRRRDRT